MTTNTGNSNDNIAIGFATYDAYDKTLNRCYDAGKQDAIRAIWTVCEREVNAHWEIEGLSRRNGAPLHIISANLKCKLDTYSKVFEELGAELSVDHDPDDRHNRVWRVTLTVDNSVVGSIHDYGCTSLLA